MTSRELYEILKAEKYIESVFINDVQINYDDLKVYAICEQEYFSFKMKHVEIGFVNIKDIKKIIKDGKLWRLD